MNFAIIAFVLLSSVFVVGAFSPLVFISEPEEPVIFFQQSQTQDVNEYDPDLNTFTTWRGYEITHNDNGDIKIVNREGDTGRMLFAITGRSRGQSLIRTSRDFDWTWNLESEKLVLFDRNTFRYYLKGENGSSVLPIEQTWSFYENNNPKLTYKITNNFQRTTNTKFWFIFVLNVNDLVEFDGVQRLLSDNSFVRLTSADGINAKEKILKINQALGLDFEDLNANGFEFTDLVLGKGEIIGKPNLVIVGIAVTKNNGVFPFGATVELDPTIFDTGEKFARKVYNEESDWTNIAFMKTNRVIPKRYAQVTLNNKDVDFNTFGKPVVSDGNVMNIPFGAEIHGIEVIVSAKMISGLCGTPAETGELQVLMIVGGALHSTFKFKTWTCGEGETIKIFGSPTDLWSFPDWNNMHFDQNNFVVRLRAKSYTNGGQWGPAPNAGVNYLKVKVYYSKNCFFLGPFFLGPFDCNCSEGISAQAGDIDIGGKDFNISGEGTFEIRANITNISKMNVQSTCRVDKFDGVILS